MELLKVAGVGVGAAAVAGMVIVAAMQAIRSWQTRNGPRVTFTAGPYVSNKKYITSAGRSAK